MLATDFPLPITHQYRMKPARARELRKLRARRSTPRLARAVAPARLATRRSRPCCLNCWSRSWSRRSSSSRPMESAKACSIRRLEPSVAAHRSADRRSARCRRRRASVRPARRPARRVDRAMFDDQPDMRRLRLASCLLADVAWQANPGFRADRAIEMALHGNWVAVDAAGRVIMAQALVVELSAASGCRRQPDAALQGGAASARTMLGRRDAPRPAAVRRRGAVLKRTSLSALGRSDPAACPPRRRSFGRGSGRTAASASRPKRSDARLRSSAASGVAFLLRRG